MKVSKCIHISPSTIHEEIYGVCIYNSSKLGWNEVGLGITYLSTGKWINTFAIFSQCYKLSKIKWLLIHIATWITAIILHENIKKKVICALWFHLYKVLEEAKIVCGNRHQNSGFLRGKRLAQKHSETLVWVHRLFSWVLCTQVCRFVKWTLLVSAFSWIYIKFE